jgi:hypothetical protein
LTSFSKQIPGQNLKAVHIHSFPHPLMFTIHESPLILQYII